MTDIDEMHMELVRGDGEKVRGEDRTLELRWSQRGLGGCRGLPAYPMTSPV